MQRLLLRARGVGGRGGCLGKKEGRKYPLPDMGGSVIAPHRPLFEEKE